VSKCVSLVFARGRYYDTERAIRWSLPRISCVIIFVFLLNVSFAVLEFVASLLAT